MVPPVAREENMPLRTRGRIAAAALLTAVLSAGALPAQAAEPEIFPAGIACAFELEMETAPGGHIVSREFLDADGNLVRILSTGKGQALTFTNADTEESVSSRSNGFTQQISVHPDGTLTVTLTGNNLLIMFPTDVPAGPSTTIYSGRVVFDIVGDVYTLRSTSGQARDICAELE
jgi:hypothetical protein